MGLVSDKDKDIHKDIDFAKDKDKDKVFVKDKDMLIMMWREGGWEALLSGFITFLLNPPATALFSCRFLKIIIVICSS